MSTLIRRRDDLRLLEGTTVLVSGRLKEFRRHEKRRDLDSVLLVSVHTTPIPLGETIFLSHIFVLVRQLKKIGCVPTQGKRISFEAVVYSYRRLGGKAIDRGLYNTEDYGVNPTRLTPGFQ